MSKQMFQYAAGRFINPAKIITANIYNKEDKIRVAIDVDVKEMSRNVVYSDPFATTQDAQNFILSIPVND